MSQYLEILKQAKSYTVNRSKINDENQKMGAKIEETAFNERNNLTRNKETQYKTYLKLKLGCEDVRIHNWKLVDLSNGYKEEKRNQQLDDKIPDVIVEFSCEGYFHNKFNISYNEIKDNKDILEIMYSVYEFDQLDLDITDKKILRQQIKKTISWIETKKKELQTNYNQELSNKLEKAKQALAAAQKFVSPEIKFKMYKTREKPLPQFEAAGIEEKLRMAFAKSPFGDSEILDQNNNVYVHDIEVNVADPFDYLRWWYPGPFQDKSKQRIVIMIASNDRKWLTYGGNTIPAFKNRIGYAFKKLQAAFKEAEKTLDPNEPNEDLDIPLFNTTNLNMNDKKIADFGTPINKPTMGDLFTLKYKGRFYYVMVDAEDNDNIKEIRLAKYLNEQAKEAAERDAMKEELVDDSDEDYIQVEEEDSGADDSGEYISDSDSDL